MLLELASNQTEGIMLRRSVLWRKPTTTRRLLSTPTPTIALLPPTRTHPIRPISFPTSLLSHTHTNPYALERGSDYQFLKAHARIPPQDEFARAMLRRHVLLCEKRAEAAARTRTLA